MMRYYNRRNKRQTRPVNGTESTKTPTDTVSPRLQPQASPSSNIFHRSVETLSWDRFMHIMLTGNLIYLVIEGQPSQQELFEAWDQISEEYSQLVRAETDDSFELFKKIHYLKWKISYISLVLDYLKEEYDEEFAQNLATLGMSLIVEKADWQEYLAQIYRVETEAKYLIVQLNQTSNEYNIMMGKSGGQPEQRNLKDFERELAILSKFQGYRIDKEKTTVSEYCGILNAYIEYCKAMSNNG